MLTTLFSTTSFLQFTVPLTAGKRAAELLVSFGVTQSASLIQTLQFEVPVTAGKRAADMYVSILMTLLDHKYVTAVRAADDCWQKSARALCLTRIPKSATFFPFSLSGQ